MRERERERESAVKLVAEKERRGMGRAKGEGRRGNNKVLGRICLSDCRHVRAKVLTLLIILNSILQVSGSDAMLNATKGYRH